ncbi:TPA: LysR family transcriptional regulator [Salmonella enterica]|uniref:LysR family transcriptional regulator n=1 Tax=Salmonella enterica TaxID=28901 RepID=A0A744CD92_SALER|nr:LysR family transcriptional regulator [Salmonella enterica]HAF4919988.1 LysR family transcriptional regulator [Salmonella enterica]
MDKTSQFPLKIQHLTALIAISETGSMTAAAQRLNLAQPALSIAIARLEERLGTALLHREPRGVQLTEAGRVLLVRAYEILELAQLSLRELDGLQREPQGEVSIGLPSSTAAVAALPIIERLSIRYPKIRLRVIETFSSYLWKWLQNGDIDMAVVFDRTPTTDLHCVPLARETMYLVSPPGSQVRLSPVDISKLGSYPLAMPSRANGFRAALEAYAKKHGVTLNVALEIDAGHHLVKLVASGRYHSVLAPCAVRDEIEARQVMAQPIQPPLTRTVCLARRKLSETSSPVHLVADEVAMECRNLIESGVWLAMLL